MCITLADIAPTILDDYIVQRGHMIVHLECERCGAQGVTAGADGSAVTCPDCNGETTEMYSIELKQLLDVFRTINVGATITRERKKIR